MIPWTVLSSLILRLKRSTRTGMRMPAPVTLIYRKTSEFGLLRDVEMISSVVGAVRCVDPLESPVATDLAIHLEIPAYVWMPWARKNVLMVNPEWWPRTAEDDAWSSYLPRFDALLFKCAADVVTFCKDDLTLMNKCFVVPWACAAAPTAAAAQPQPQPQPPLWLLGGSVSKRAAAAAILPLWPADHPLDVYTTATLDIPGVPDSVRIHVKNLESEERARLQAASPLHLIFSEAEAFGMAAAEGEAAGAFLLGNELPVYKEMFNDTAIASLIPATLEPKGATYRDTFAGLTATVLAEALANAAARLSDPMEAVIVRSKAIAASDTRRNSFREALAIVLNPLLHLSPATPRVLPPYLSNAELPSISIVTLTYNRRKFLDLCFLNLLSTDYPKEKIEWVVVDDSDDAENQGADKIMKFGRQCAPISLTYLPLAKKTSIGAKRNLGCLRAQHGIILMMDDDDHYPPSSFRRRVAWLMHEWIGHARVHAATVATTIATYGLTTGVSAVNTPPLGLPLRQRISEATLTFSKSWWEERGFPEVSLAEGEGFLAGREGDVLEIPANQIIVAMSHGKSASQRRVPEGKPGCFWGFDPEFLTFLHGLAGVAVESEAAALEAPVSAASVAPAADAS